MPGPRNVVPVGEGWPLLDSGEGSVGKDIGMRCILSAYDERDVCNGKDKFCTAGSGGRRLLASLEGCD